MKEENEPMVRLPICTCPFKIRDDWRNPDGIEPHVLDVIQVAYDALVSSTAILEVACIASWPRPVRERKPVRDKLVNSR